MDAARARSYEPTARTPSSINLPGDDTLRLHKLSACQKHLLSVYRLRHEVAQRACRTPCPNVGEQSKRVLCVCRFCLELRATRWSRSIVILDHKLVHT